MEKFNIEMTKDEMIRYYANKIVEDGIRGCFEFSNTIDINNYGNIAKYKNEILEKIYRDERVADVNIDEEGKFDMVFYTDFCPLYYDSNALWESDYEENPLVKKHLLEEFRGLYVTEYIFENPYISVTNLLNAFADKQSVITENKEIIKNVIKKVLSESGFLDKNLDGIYVYITPNNYNELEKVIEEAIQNCEQEELE